jgi:hypothetical protein
MVENNTKPVSDKHPHDKIPIPMLHIHLDTKTKGSKKGKNMKPVLKKENETIIGNKKYIQPCKNCKL